MQKRTRKMTVALAGMMALCWMTVRAAEIELTFRDGEDDYSGTRMAEINSLGPGGLSTAAHAPVQVANAALITFHTLLRFDGVAEAVYRRLEDGHRIRAAEIELTWHSTVSHDREWHLRANLLRRPWWPDRQYGPNWLASVRDLSWWGGDGAGDPEHDQFPEILDRQTLWGQRPVAALDLTAALNDPAYGATAAQRLRQFEQNGVVIRKLEDYPYAGWSIRFWGAAAPEVEKRPRLRIVLEAGETPELGDLPPSVAMEEYVERLRDEGGRGQSAFTITDDMLAFVQGLAATTGRDDEPAWRRERRQELLELLPRGGDYLGGVEQALREGAPEGIVRANLHVLNNGAAQWMGWTAWEVALVGKQFWPALFPSAQRRLQNFFDTWLRTSQIEFVADQVQWFRSRAAWSHSEQLWNHPASGQAVVILGGEVARSPHVVAEGEHHLHGFLEAASQLGSIGEFVAAFYNAMTISAFQSIADWADKPVTRLQASLIEQLLMLDLVERYHPPTREVVSPFSRSMVPFVVGAYDGMKYLLHAVSEQGTLMPKEDIFPEGTAHNQGRHPLYSVTVPPSRVALADGWRPPLATHLTDRKPIPYQVRSFSRWGRNPNRVTYLTTYLDRHYGLASQCTLMQDSGQGFALTAYWRRRGEGPLESLRDQCSLYTHYIANDRLPLQANRYWSGGQLGNPDHTLRNDGAYHSVQHENKIIELSGPWGRENGHLTSLAHKVFVANFGGIDQVWVDDRQVAEYPVRATFGQNVFIADDPVYVAIIPLEATDLGRSDQIVLEHANEHLIVSAYNFQSTEPATLNPQAIDAARAGVIIEMGQREQFPTLDDFRAHIAAARIEQTEQDGVWSVSYRSGGDTLEIALRLADKHTRRDSVVRRLVNGESPELPDGIVRNSPAVVHGSTGELRKGDAVLRSTPGQPAWLHVDPVTGGYEVVNPHPEKLLEFVLTTPRGNVRSDAFGMGRIRFEPGADPAVEIETHVPASVLVSATVGGGLRLNGRPVTTAAVTHEGESYRRIGITADP